MRTTIPLLNIQRSFTIGFEQRSRAIQPVHELAVGQRHEQRQNNTEMHDQEQPHGGVRSQHQQEETGQTRQKQQEDERLVQVRGGTVAQRRITARTDDEQSGGANEQGQALAGAENDRQACVTIWREPAEGMVDRGNGCRGETQQKSVKRGVMEPPSPWRARLLRRRTVRTPCDYLTRWA